MYFSFHTSKAGFAYMGQNTLSTSTGLPVKKIHERGGLFSFNPTSDRNYEKFPDF